MLDDDAIEARLALLREPLWSPRLIEDVYGLRLPDEQLLGRVRSWAARLRKPRPVEREGRIDRVLLENYFQWSRTLPNKWAAARLGMSQRSFEEVLARMEECGVFLRNTFDFSAQTVEESLIRDVRSYFPELQSRLFSDHDAWARAVHQAVESALGVAVEPIFCVTSCALGEDPPDYAHEFDIITGDPVGLRYTVWLDLGKPINLRPDVCATLTYAQHKAVMAPYLFPEAPPDLPQELAGR